MRISSTPTSSTSASAASTAAYTAARIESLKQTRDRAALSDFSAGKILPFIDYANATMGDRSGDELKRWQGYLSDAELRRDELVMQAGVDAGDISLERLLDFLNVRRNELNPYDPEYANITKQIADTKNGIAARDFNAEINAAQAKMVDAGSTTSAKEDYLRTLVGAYTRAKDSGAQKALQTQITQLRTEIQKDHVLQRAQADNAYLIRYYTPGGGVSGQEALNYLAERAANADTPEEANRYASLAAQIATRERTLQTQRLRAAASGGGGGGGAPSLTQVANDIKTQTTQAVDLFKRSVGSGRPDDRAFMLAREATDRELNAIDSALPGATPSAARTLLARRDAAEAAIQAAQRQGALKLVAVEQDSNTVFNDNLKQLRESGAAPEEIARAISSRIGQITLRRSSILFDGLTNDPQTDGELAKMEAVTRGRLTNDAQDAGRVIAGGKGTLTEKIDAEYLRYRSGFVAQGKTPPVGVDEWMRYMSGNLSDEEAAAKLGVSAKGTDVQAFRIERDNARRLNQERQAEVNAATDKYVAAAWPRNDTTGERYPYIASPATPSALGTGVQPGPNATDAEKLAFLQGGIDPFEAAYMRRQLHPDVTGTGDTLPPDQQPTDGGDTGAGPLTGHAGPMAMREMGGDPHAMADAFLAMTPDFTVPTWEIPSLPPFSPFAPQLDPGTLDEYAPPDLPSFYAPSFADALPTGSMPALSAGNVEPPPAVGSAPGEAVGGPQLQA